MIERIEAPEGVIGLRSSGKLTREDYTEVLEPALKAAVEGGGIRLLFVLDDFAKETHAFAWLAPGEVRVYGSGELDEATAWVAG